MLDSVAARGRNPASGGITDLKAVSLVEQAFSLPEPFSANLLGLWGMDVILYGR
jgi:hypothetical protein